MDINISDFIDLKKFTPHYNKELYIVTPFGIRSAVFNRGTFGFILTDCTHPLQNSYLADYFVSSWTYKNKSDRDNIADLIDINHYEREKEGSKILSSIKITKWDRLRLWFNSF